MTNADIATRFTNDTAEHQMTVLHDDGLYRNLRFRSPAHGMYWFDLITTPGTLIFQGDGDSFVFSRIKDMFAFFRGPAGQINPSYWSEKLTSGREQVKRYDQDLLQKHVEDLVAEIIEDEAEAAESPEECVMTGLVDAVRAEIVDELTGDEAIDRDLVEQFRYNPSHQTGREEPDFEFTDTWEWDCRDYHWWFLWACHAIVWGISQYDSHHEKALVSPATASNAALT